ncbi:MAG: LysE family transporter [Bacteroidales bacterium]|jgi:threonine/homoserine/homoserine lactone efflux protein|nr:LysE family transporter [Bacteroidales bacterium]
MVSALHPLFEGMILGLTVAITLGPALFALLQTSLKHGIKIGIFLALGIFSSDLTLVVGCFFGATQIITDPGYHLFLGIFGGVVLCAYGLYTFFKKVSLTEQVEAIDEIKVKKKGALPYFFKGFVLNIANPMLWAFWITSVVAITATYGGDKKNVALFFAGTLGIILTTDILKVVLANKIKFAGNPQVKLWMNRIVGLLFLVIGLFIITGSLLEYFRGISIKVP